jgi:hypothetical protein
LYYRAIQDLGLHSVLDIKYLRSPFYHQSSRGFTGLARQTYPDGVKKSKARGYKPSRTNFLADNSGRYGLVQPSYVAPSYANSRIGGAGRFDRVASRYAERFVQDRACYPDLANYICGIGTREDTAHHSILHGGVKAPSSCTRRVASLGNKERR